MSDFSRIRDALQSALVALADFVRLDRILGAQVPEGRAEFFGEGGTGAVGPAGAQRFLEWFALERRAHGSGGPPLAAFLASGCPGLAPEYRPFAEALAASRVGIFQIREAGAETLEIEDAVSGDVLELWMPEAERRSPEGDSLVGRLVPVPGTDRWIATDSAELFRGPAVFRAYAEAAARLRVETGAEGLPPVSQLEIERFVEAARAGEAESVAAVEEELARFLASAPPEAGLPSAAQISHALSGRTSPGPVLGPFLDEVAFKTSLDLEKAQRLGLRLWNAWQREGPRSQERARRAIPPAELGKQVAAELDRGLANGENLEHLFDRLERMVGEDRAEPGELPEELRWHTEDEGDLSALLTEYLWDRERVGEPVADEDRRRLLGLRDQLEAMGIREVERIGPGELARALAERWATGQTEECLATATALAGFGSWVEATQDLALLVDPVAFLARLEREEQRTRDVAGRLESEAVEGAPVRAWRVVAEEPEAWRIRAGDEDALLDRSLPLAVGDLLLGAFERGAFARGMRVLPDLFARSLLVEG